MFQILLIYVFMKSKVKKKNSLQVQLKRVTLIGVARPGCGAITEVP